MSRYRALILYDELLRGFQNQLADHNVDLVTSLQDGFGFLISRLNLQNVSLFEWDATKQVLNMKYSFRGGILMEGEEEISIKPGSVLWPMIHDQIPVVSSKSPWVSFIPLWTDNKLFGVIRMIRHHRLPRGKVLASMPRFTSQKPRQNLEYPLLEDLADILSVKLQGISREENYRKKAQFLTAGSEVAAAIVETPRLHEMLESVAKSIVKHLGFDRIRFYLVDSSHTELRGILGLQIPQRLLNIENEKYQLKPYVNSLVDAVLDGKSEQKFISAGGKVVYIPLVVSGQVIGCVAVDNLLSQVRIDEEQISTLKSLAGHIGMSVLNARLFEDIEQQAITDGLTKLYVYRYFQQRLKEEIDRADRYSYSLALVMLDVDNFKTFNDTYGHALGDKVLEFLANTIRTNIRRIDLAARYGGDEFILLLPEITEQEVWMMGSRLLNALKETTLTTNDGQEINVRVTIGIAMYPSDGKGGRDLMESADQALYWGKKNGRGDLCFYQSISQKKEKTV